MLIRLKKVPDRAVLTIIRADGSTEVQRTGHAGFFALHDLLHYSVESTLACTNTFYALLAQGWSFDTFADKDDPRYRAVPDQANQIEMLVSVLTRHALAPERLDPDLRRIWAEDINSEWSTAMQSTTIAIPEPLPLDQLLAISAAFESLSTRWATMNTGDHLELPWPAPRPPRSPR